MALAAAAEEVPPAMRNPSGDGYFEVSQEPDLRSSTLTEVSSQCVLRTGAPKDGSSSSRWSHVLSSFVLVTLGCAATATWLLRRGERHHMLRAGKVISAQSSGILGKYMEVPEGLCDDFDWEAITDKVACETAATEMNLESKEVVHMTVAQWPNGCNYFRNATADGPDTLFLNRNPTYQGDGRSTTDLAQGGLRELICSIPEDKRLSQEASAGLQSTQAPAQAPSTTSSKEDASEEDPCASSTTSSKEDASEEDEEDKRAGGGAKRSDGEDASAGEDEDATEADRAKLSQVSCTFTVGKEGSNTCPEGSIPLIEDECRTMPYHFGGSLHTPFEVDSEIDPVGCFFNYPNYFYNTNPLGNAREHRTPYCKRCEVGDKGTQKMDGVDAGDWTEWDDNDGEKISIRYRKIPLGKCSDLDLYPIFDRDECERASEELGLTDVPVPAMSTMLAERPAGCYYFRNYQDGTGTLWLNQNPYSKENGAETSDLAQGMLRQPVCAMKKGADLDESNLEADMPRYRKLTHGTCSDIGAHTIRSQVACEAAARSLGLVDTVSSAVDRDDRPEGCYYFRNFEDLTATLWINTNEAAKGKGSETSDEAEGLMRQPICDTDAPVVMGSSKYQMLSNGSCASSGLAPVREQDECEAAARDLALEHVGGLLEDTAIVANLADSPEGCYYFWNSADSTATLWLNTNPSAEGRGAEASESDRGLLRQPICRGEDAKVRVLNSPYAALDWDKASEDTTPAKRKLLDGSTKSDESIRFGRFGMSMAS
jgi:hypothetical protein